MNPQHIVYGVFFLLVIGIIVIAIDPNNPKTQLAILQHCGMKNTIVDCMYGLADKNNPENWSSGSYIDSGLTFLTEYEYKITTWKDYEQSPYYKKQIAELRGIA